MTIINVLVVNEQKHLCFSLSAFCICLMPLLLIVYYRTPGIEDQKDTALLLPFHLSSSSQNLDGTACILEDMRYQAYSYNSSSTLDKLGS